MNVSNILTNLLYIAKICYLSNKKKRAEELRGSVTLKSNDLKYEIKELCTKARNLKKPESFYAMAAKIVSIKN